MRKFRFVGDPSEMHWHINPEKGESYDILQLNAMRNGDLLEFWMIENDRSWIEVSEEGNVSIEDMNRAYDKAIGFNSKPLHKDTDLGYYAGLAMQGILANEELRRAVIMDAINGKVSSFEAIQIESVRTSKELIKQLNEETK